MFQSTACYGESKVLTTSEARGTSAFQAFLDFFKIWRTQSEYKPPGMYIYTTTVMYKQVLKKQCKL